MNSGLHVAILGASGYGAGELLRLLVHHPHAKVVSLSSSSHAGASVGEVHPHLRGFYDLILEDTIDVQRLLDAEQAVVFSAVPHGASASAIEALLRRAAGQAGNHALRVIDLSGDLRLKDLGLHRAHYPETPILPDLRRACARGVPELFRENIRESAVVANPGCLACASILAIAPLATREFSGAIAVDAKTGSSGSGRQLKDTTHHPTRHANFRAYKPLIHQHEPEILEALGDPRGSRLRVSFVAHSMDTARGIYVTAHTALPEPANSEALRQRYVAFYSDHPFVRVGDQPPELQNVVGSNFCDVAVFGRGHQVVAMAALDNLVKGMAGTAIQNMNLMCGVPEITGLWSPSLRPL